MKEIPQQHRSVYKMAWDAAVNRMTRDFIVDFCFPDGSIDWQKLVQFNSGMQPENQPPPG